MRFLRGLVGGLLGAIPGVALTPVLEFFAMVVILLGIIAGAMIGVAPKGRRMATALGAGIGVVAGVAVALMPGRFGFLPARVQGTAPARSSEQPSMPTDGGCREVRRTLRVLPSSGTGSVRPVGQRSPLTCRQEGDGTAQTHDRDARVINSA